MIAHGHIVIWLMWDHSLCKIPHLLIYLFVCSSIQHLLLVTVCCDEQGFPDGSSGKESAYKVGDTVDADLFPGLGRSSAGEWQPPPGFLPGKSHGQRSLAGYIPWGQEESDTTEHACAQCIVMSIRGTLIMKIRPSPHPAGVCCSELNHQP